ncbi:MAG: hypothetical protein AVDCRST_MAG52-892, partial [uncultured Blastococcus sp.]
EPSRGGHRTGRLRGVPRRGDARGLARRRLRRERRRCPRGRRARVDHQSRRGAGGQRAALRPGRPAALLRASAHQPQARLADLRRGVGRRRGGAVPSGGAGRHTGRRRHERDGSRAGGGGTCAAHLAVRRATRQALASVSAPYRPL